MAALLCFCYMYVNVIAEVKNLQSKRTYIIRMDKSNMPASFDDHLQWYDSSLKSVSESAGMLYTYNNVIHGFSTRLTPEEAESLEKQQGILSVLPEMVYELHTTRTPEFLGLGKSDAVLPEFELVSEVVVGVLDTGVWPELKSFDDKGLGPTPSTWKGECETGKNFNSSSCNRKLIGARFFSQGYEAAFGPIDETMESKSPRDDDGHGTHTSTTAAGSAVSGASLFGYATGKARGMATQARVAAYKVCWLGGCFGSDIIAAMDKAVEDGVNVISMSIGGGLFDYYRDTVAIGAFTATAHGILVSCSAGNDGPSNVSNSTSGFLCMSGTLIPAKVSGKIVICDRGGNSRVEKGVEVKHAGGLGMILANTELYGEELIADSHILATAAMGQSSAAAIKNYAFSDPKPVATIASGRTRLGVEPSPVVAHSVLEVQIQSPQRRVTFNIISGTSMSCPHVSGLAALLKAAHSDWSPGAIRSALMTTAYTKYKNGKTILDVSTGQPSTPLDYGAGYVNPVAALDPGLVYDTTVEDYLGFLCALNYSSSQIKLATNRDFTCDPSKKYSLGDLNYPSFSVPLQTASGKGVVPE
ncbi:hypothetical protein GH714_011782 [Hevea brasiliensis]|uniref:Inhibitor I9 domain-containing protein n=1 Tax=Hevea brasiliensis TaxID=3981 RepID=A0A6A6NGM2_HEVBR|nr:hypothetical protein GH714_011782 [Hevea brasiliensis]